MSKKPHGKDCLAFLSENAAFEHELYGFESDVWPLAGLQSLIDLCYESESVG